MPEPIALTVREGEHQFVITEAECPYCGHKTRYRISVQGAHANAYSIWDQIWIKQFTVFVPFLLAAFLLPKGWQVLVLAVVIAVVISVIDWLLARGFSIVTRMIANLVAHIRRLRERAKFRGEISVQPFRVVVPCSYLECPNTERKFLTTLMLPIEKQGYNLFSVTDIEISE